MATVTVSPQLTVNVDLIDAPQHVREPDPEHVRSLAGSIALQGVVVPIVVRAAGERHELVADRLPFAEAELRARATDSSDG